MAKPSLEALRAARIAHVAAHVAGNTFESYDVVFRNFEFDMQKMRPIAYSFASFATGNGVLAWFVDHDLESTRRWSYLAAKATRLAFQFPEPGTLVSRDMMFQFLLSGHPKLINWVAQNPIYVYSKKYDDPKNGDYYKDTIHAALMGDMKSALKKANLALNAEDKSKIQRQLLPHYLYLSALGSGDRAGMTGAILEFTKGSLYRHQNNTQSGLTADLYSATAVFYTKLAWMNGFELDIQSEHIPMEWMPFVSLADYPEPVQFLRDFDIDTPMQPRA